MTIGLREPSIESSILLQQGAADRSNKNKPPATSKTKPEAAPLAFNPNLNTRARSGDVNRVAAIRITASAEQKGATSNGWINDVPYD